MKSYWPFGWFYWSFPKKKSFLVQQLKHPIEFLCKLVWSHLLTFVFQKPSFIYSPSICTLPSCRKSWDKNPNSILYESGSRLSLNLERNVPPVSVSNSISQLPQYLTFILLREAIAVETQRVGHRCIWQSSLPSLSNQGWRFCFCWPRGGPPHDHWSWQIVKIVIHCIHLLFFHFHPCAKPDCAKPYTTISEPANEQTCYSRPTPYAWKHSLFFYTQREHHVEEQTSISSLALRIIINVWFNIEIKKMR